MSEKKRRWFRIHLSTAIVLMFVAGAVLWANTIPQDGGYYQLFYPPEMFVKRAFGFPLKFLIVSDVHSGMWNYGALTANIVAALTILSAVTFVCEWRIRREARKP